MHLTEPGPGGINDGTPTRLDSDAIDVEIAVGTI